MIRQASSMKTHSVSHYTCLMGKQRENRPANENKHSSQLVKGITSSTKKVWQRTPNFHKQIKHLLPSGNHEALGTGKGPRDLRAVHLHLGLTLWLEAEVTPEKEGAINEILPDNLNVGIDRPLNRRRIPIAKPITMCAPLESQTLKLMHLSGTLTTIELGKA